MAKQNDHPSRSDALSLYNVFKELVEYISTNVQASGTHPPISFRFPPDESDQIPAKDKGALPFAADSVMVPVQFIVILVLHNLSGGRGVLFPQEPSEETGACLRSGDPLLPCVMSGAVSWAESVKSREIHVGDGLVLIPEPGEEEPMTGDPREARTLLEAMDRAMSRRRLVWDMDWIYPGLSMVVSRSPDPHLYFTVDRRMSIHDVRETTGRLIVKRTVLPVLLGVNLKLASLAPLLVAALVLLAKKALLLSKLSLLVTGLAWYRGNSGSHFSGVNSGSNGPILGSGGNPFGVQPHSFTEDSFFGRQNTEEFTNSTNSFFL